MGYSLEFIESLLELDKNQIVSLSSFIKELDQKQNFDYDQFLKKAQSFAKTKKNLNIFSTYGKLLCKYSELITILENKKLLKKIIDSMGFSYSYDAILHLLNNIIENYDKKALIMENLSKIKDLGITKIYYSYGLAQGYKLHGNQILRVEEKRNSNGEYQLSSFYTDGEKGLPFQTDFTNTEEKNCNVYNISIDGGNYMI